VSLPIALRKQQRLLIHSPSRTSITFKQKHTQSVSISTTPQPAKKVKKAKKKPVSPPSSPLPALPSAQLKELIFVREDEDIEEAVEVEDKDASTPPPLPACFTSI
jgi:hypothetical protein